MAMDPTSGGGGGESGGGPLDEGAYAARPARVSLYLRVAAGAGALLGLFIALSFLRSAYADWLWFSHLEFASVFSTMLFTRVWLYVAGLVGAGAVVGFSYWWAYKTSWGPTTLPFSPELVTWVHRGIITGMAVVGAIVTFSFASALSDRWLILLRFMNAQPFGLDDPQFGNDVGFYVFTMPVLHTVQGWLMALIIVTALTTLGLYLVIFSARGLSPMVAPAIRTQLATAGAALMITIAFAHFLDIYETLFSTSGAVTGATYADVAARMPALRVLTVIALVSGGIMLFAIRVQNLRQSMRLIVAAFGLWVLAALLVGVMWPALVQRFAVEPSELERERPYIERNIEWTRMGFDLDLDRVSERPYDVNDENLAADIAANPETINNIRLWDPRPLEDVYNQVQHLRLYYNFLDVDVDRYVIDGEYRQVLLGTREVLQAGLDETAQNWVNRRLVYTHGYGVVMSTATDFTPTGQPNFVIRDIPTVGPADGAFDIDEPRIYYGEVFGRSDREVRAPAGQELPPGAVTDDVVVVNTTEPQFDRPGSASDSLPVFLERYEGTGGVVLSSFFRRALFAWELGDLNILISGQLRDDSRVLYRRNIHERVREVAPFLLLDDDPYMVVDEGRLFWIQDTYLTTDRIPYSRRQTLELEDASRTGSFNYIRNSVKVVIDAFNGSMVFYTIESEERPDPLLGVYRSAFPDLFKPISEMPPGLREHIRYPEELLRAQADAYMLYHMTDAKEFFLKEDQWELAQEVVGFEGREREIAPYYVIMKLPGEETAEFVLILPFTPRDKPNLVAWMAARSDGEHYGELITFVFPKDRLFEGPGQIEARIDNNTVISEQFTLWDQSGSRVFRGNLLVIPIGEALLYVEPIYLQADSVASVRFPELKRVILATASTVVMEKTLDEAVRALLGGERVARPPNAAGGEPVAGGIAPADLAPILSELRAAVEALQGGAEALGGSVEALDDLIGGGAE
ncbi:MAG: UPF0182 family protein [Chloroflexi bacterium]|nr:UPF0182 family protein [Chloroflexota bacterium]